MAEKRLLYGLLHRSAADWFDLHGLSAPVRRVLYGAGGDLAERSTDASALAYALIEAVMLQQLNSGEGRADELAEVLVRAAERCSGARDAGGDDTSDALPDLDVGADA